MSRTLQVTATIAASAATSGEVNLPDGYDIVGMYAPVCTGTTLTFTASPDVGGTFREVTSSAQTAVSFTLSSTAYYMTVGSVLAGVQNLKLVSGSTEAAARDFVLVIQKRAT